MNIPSPDIIKLLVSHTGLLPNDVRRLIASASVSYKTYRIPKRSGGTREISQPTREVKILQRILIDNFLINLPIHQCATAYRKGSSIRENAVPHAGAGRPILKMDFEAFFPSIRAGDWLAYCERNSILRKEDAVLAAKLMFRKVAGMRDLRLAIGAPSSPILSNILMYDFDESIFQYAISEKIIYTRYADDLTFSAKRAGFFSNCIKTVRKNIKNLNGMRLSINEEKTVFIMPRYSRTVTGLTLANDGRVTIGREKKRYISACVHKALQENLNDEDLKRLSGYLAYIISVEPDFIEKLELRYGKDIILKIKSYGNPRIKV